VQDHDDYDQPLALGQVRISRPGLTDIAVHQLTHDSSKSVDAGRGPMRGGDVREGLHEGVRRGVLVGIRPRRIPHLAPSLRVTAVVGGPRCRRT